MNAIARLEFAPCMVMLACGATAACSDTTTSPFPSQEGAAESDAAGGTDASTVACTLSGDTCGLGCCAPAPGRRVDSSKQCLLPAAPLFCPGPGADCVSNHAEGCLVRRGDGGGDDDVFYTPSSWRNIPGFEACADDVYQRIASLPDCQ